MPPRPAPRTGTRARATVTRAFLFSDLRGYTDFVESKGDAAAADLLRAYRDIVRAEIARHAGAEIKTEGDSFYVVFESPSAAHECVVRDGGPRTAPTERSERARPRLERRVASAGGHRTRAARRRRGPAAPRSLAA